MQSTRGHSLCKEKTQFRHQYWKGFFTVREVQVYNAQQEVVMADTFRKGLDAYLMKNCIEGYN